MHRTTSVEPTTDWRRVTPCSCCIRARVSVASCCQPISTASRVRNARRVLLGAPPQRNSTAIRFFLRGGGSCRKLRTRTCTRPQRDPGARKQRRATLTRRLTDSMASRKTSFLRYLMPSERHDTAFVTAIGGRGATSNLLLSCVMYLWKTRARRVDLCEKNKNQPLCCFSAACIDFHTGKNMKTQTLF